MSYILEFTESDIETIGFVGHRYCWSDSLRHMAEGENEISECEAWEINEAFQNDTEGGHSYFPMLSHSSDLCAKLVQFMDSIV